RARIDAADRAAATAASLATWDAAEYVCFALQTVAGRMAPAFLDLDVTGRLVETVRQTAPALVEAAVPQAVSWVDLTDVLRRLVEEEVGIGDMARILEALSQPPPGPRDTVLLAEQVRHALREQITAKHLRGRDALPVLLLDPEIEVLFNGAIQRTAIGSYLALAPEHMQDVLAALRGAAHALGPGMDGVVVLVTDAEVRRYVRKLVEPEFPTLHVVSRRDLAPDTRLHAAGHVRLGSPAPAPEGGPSA
ncbi:MAG: FHIPEP family type III secretion protein, partial [Rhodothermales bacterium]|nr:FHIPEP family type III secretion protein [Rhodothermales bacterium]